MENMEKKDAGLPAGKKKRKIPWSMLYILATVVAVLLFGLFNQQFGNVFHTISNLTPGFLSLGVLISLVYFLFEGEIFRLLLRSQGYRISVVEGLKNALLGLYYSYITPSSTGGQPMQSAYLLRDNKIPAGISTAVLIVKFMCFQCAFVLVSVVSFIGMYGNLAANNPTIIRSAPLLVAQTFVKNRCGYERDGSFTTDREDGWQYYDCGIAAQTFCLAAHDLGLATVIMGVFDRKRLQEYLQVPEDQELMALIAVGYPAQVGGAPKRKGVDVLLSWK